MEKSKLSGSLGENEKVNEDWGKINMVDGEGGGAKSYSGASNRLQKKRLGAWGGG